MSSSKLYWAVSGVAAMAIATGFAYVASYDPNARLPSGPAGSADPAGGREPGDPNLHRKLLLSPVYEVDRPYRSMTGPQDTRDLTLIQSDKPELAWITGFSATMVGEDGETAMPQDFMCHSNLDIDPTFHREQFGHDMLISGRLFTLSQGQLDITLPDGFGIPVLSNEVVSLTTQVLNLNMKEGVAKVRHKIDLKYKRESEVEEPLKPLFVSGVYGLALLEGEQSGTQHEEAYFGVENPDADEHGPGCLVGKGASEDQFIDEQGRKFTGHWVIKNGREENRTLVTKILNLPFDTTIHYIAVHLHPFAESLVLRDLTTDKTVYAAKARQFDDRVGLEHVDFFSSEEGIEVFKDHEYELVSVYNNTTDQEHDSMAVMLLYMLDKEFRHHSRSQARSLRKLLMTPPSRLPARGERRNDPDRAVNDQRS